MEYTKPLFTPREVWNLTGLTPETLRDYRHRGYIDGFGSEQPNGRWLYSLSDVVRLSITQIIRKSGFCFVSALDYSRFAEIALIDAVFGGEGVYKKEGAGLSIAFDGYQIMGSFPEVLLPMIRERADAEPA